MTTTCVTCLDCKIQTKVINFGDGYVAVCPKCQKVIYNSEKLPEKEK